MKSIFPISIVLFFFPISNSHSSNVSAFYEKSTNFISNVVKHHLQNCDLVFAHDNHFTSKSVIEDVLTSLVSSDSTSSIFADINGAYIVDVWKNASFFEFEEIYQKSHGAGCSVVILMIHELTPPNKPENLEIYTHLFQLLTPLYAPLTRKDEDHYFFLCGESTTDQLISSPKFGNKIKYKIALEESENGRVSFKTVHFYLNDGSPVILKLGLNDTHKNLTVGRIFPDFTHNHYGRGIKASCPDVAARLEIELLSDGRHRMKRGYYKYWFDAAKKTFNLTWDIIIPEGKGTGALLKNGTWVGVAADVLYERAEVGIVIAHIYDRHKFVEWSGPLSYEWMVFVCHKPNIYFSPAAIFWPFTPLLWALFFVAIVGVIFTIKLLIRVKLGPDDRKWPILRIFIYVYSSLMEQDQADPSGPSQMAYTSIRVLCAFWLLFVLVVACAYRAKLVSVIAFPVSSWVPETFEELAESHFRPGLNTIGKGGAAYTRFSTSPSPIFRKLFQKMEVNSNGLECFRQAMKEDICYIVWLALLEYEGPKNIIDKFGRSPLQISTSTTFFVHDGLIWPKRAIFRKHFDLTIWNAVSMGMTDQWKKMDFDAVRKARNVWEKAEGISERNFGEDDGPQKLKIVHFTGAFAILSGGILMAAVIFILEMILVRCKSRIKLTLK